MTGPLELELRLRIQRRLLQDRQHGVDPDRAAYHREFAGYEALVDAVFSELAEPEAQALPPSDATEIAPGSRLGRYRIERFLGQGGQGAVYLAHDGKLQRKVAIKVLSPRFLLSRAARLRFEREAEITSRLDHPGICSIYEVGEEGLHRYIVMRHVEGEPLAARIARCPGQCVALEEVRLPKDCGDSPRSPAMRVASLIEQAARALHVAHEAGVIHRDVKPGNLIVTPGGDCVVMDFGLARADDDGPTLTADGDVLGTPAYMAPEQLRGAKESVDRRVDVWSLGVTLYESLFGQLPFSAPTREGLFNAILSDDPIDVRRSSGVLPRDLWVVIATALDKDPQRRYLTAAAFADDLRRVRRREPIAAIAPSSWTRLVRWTERNRGLAAGLVMTFATLAAGIVVALLLLARARHERDRRDELAMFTLIDRANAELSDLVAGSADGASLDRWAAERAAPLLDELPRLRAGLQALRDRALPWTAADQERDLQRHERWPELARLRANLVGVRRGQDIAAGRVPFDPTRDLPQLDAATQRLSPFDLANLCFRILNPESEPFGQESRALALARLALDKWRATQAERVSESYPSLRPHLHMLMAFALLANGQDDAAREQAKTASEVAEREEQPEINKQLEAFRNASVALRGEPGRATLAELERQVAALAAEVTPRRTWRFETAADAERHDVLSRLVAALETFERESSGTARRRANWMRQEAQSIAANRICWLAAAAAIRSADGRTASAAYRTDPPLELQPQPGLAPIGKNPVTGLWEFYHLRTAADPTRIPQHDANGHIEVTADTGIVFVLVPPGEFLAGAQSRYPDKAGYDGFADDAEGPPSRTRVAPFFLARHELTHAQWQRLTGGEVSGPGPTTVLYEGVEPIRWTHPVHGLALEKAREVLRLHELRIPGEREWEYACRAGTTAPWFSGDDADSLRGFANIADAAVQAQGQTTWHCASWPDAFRLQAPVGRLDPNPWGFHDLLGNLAEWCETETLQPAVLHGGSFASHPTQARATARIPAHAANVDALAGVRPARSLDR